MSAQTKRLTADVINWGGPERARSDFALTEVGAAQSFAAACGSSVRFDHRRARWLVWADHHWTPDADGAVFRLAIDHVRRQQHRALDVTDTFERGKAVDHWLKFDRRAALDNLLALARSIKPIADAGANWDADPWLLGTPSGVVDLRTGHLRAGVPADRISMQTTVPFVADAGCERFDRFVSEVQPDSAIASYLWRVLGYSLTGDMSEQSFWVWFGRGSNGKSTLLDVVASLMGDYAVTVPFTAFEQARPGALAPEVAALDGRRLVLAAESRGGWLGAGKLKDITGGEQVAARHLYGQPFTFRPVCKIILSTNELPKVGDDSDGLWRRLRQVPFSQRFSGSTEDRRLKDTLLAEAPGILHWLVRGCLAWQSLGLDAPAPVTDATAQYRHDSDILGPFLEEACVLIGSIGATDLYQHYSAWAIRAGLSERERLGATAFYRKCSERFPRTKTRSCNVYEGVSRA
ncbi:MAG: phage/plasmid primase, P4 family [Acidobacteriota bacterium]